MASDPMYDTLPTKPQSWNKFSYVRNNPMRHTDPRGTMGIMQNDGPLIDQPATGPVFSPEQLMQIRGATRNVGEMSKVGSMAFGGAALMAIEVPVLAGIFGATAEILGYVAIGSDLVVWIMDPTSGESTMVLVADGVAIVIGRWAADALEEFLMAPKGVGAAADALTGAGVDAVTDHFLRKGGTKTTPKGPFIQHPFDEPEPKTEVKTSCPGCPSCCGE
jgi:hypothetical protein